MLLDIFLNLLLIIIPKKIHLLLDILLFLQKFLQKVFFFIRFSLRKIQTADLHSERILSVCMHSYKFPTGETFNLDELNGFEIYFYPFLLLDMYILYRFGGSHCRGVRRIDDDVI